MTGKRTTRTRAPRWIGAAVALAAVAAVWPATAQDQPAAGVSTNAVAAPPPEVQQGMLEVAAFIRDGEIAQAEALLKELMASHPEEPVVRKQLSLLLIREMDYEGAMELMAPLLDGETRDYVLLNNAAWIYAAAPDKALRDSGKAISLAQQALLIAPQNPSIWSTLAEAYYADGRFDKAAKAIQEAVRLTQEVNTSANEQLQFKEQAERIAKAARALSLIE